MTDPYALEPEPGMPALPGEPVVRETEDHLIDVLAADIYLHALNCVQSFGDFHIAIGTGRFQERVCRRLMTDPAVRQLPWKYTHVWAVADAPDEIWGSRFTAILDLLEGHAGIPDSNLHLPDLDEPGPDVAYERRLQQTLAWREKGHDRLDLALVSLESSGAVAGVDHTRDAGDRLFIPSTTEADDDGFVMTRRLLDATRLIAITALGEQTRAALTMAPGSPALPRPLGGTLRWYVDRAACPA